MLKLKAISMWAKDQSSWTFSLAHGESLYAIRMNETKNAKQSREEQIGKDRGKKQPLHHVSILTSPKS